MLKSILKFIIILIPWFFTSLICNNYSYFDTINVPSFTIPKSLFGIAWTVLYILISISIYMVLNNKYIDLKEYKKTVLTNYIFNQLYVVLFFCLRSNFFAFVDTVAIFITSLFLYYETKYIDKKASLFLIPYVIFSLYATILSVSVYFLNL